MHNSNSQPGPLGGHHHTHRCKQSNRDGLAGEVGPRKRADSGTVRLVVKPLLPLHRLLQIRGLLIYVVRRYKWLNPYIKGLHLTIDSWRPGRADNGFKLNERELKQAMAFWESNKELDFGLCGRRSEEEDHASATGDRKQPDDGPPEAVQPVDRFRRDMTCLMDLTSPVTPPRQLY